MRDLLLVTGGSFFLLGMAVGIVVGHHLSRLPVPPPANDVEESPPHE